MKILNKEIIYQYKNISVDHLQNISFIKTMVKQWGISSIIQEVVKILKSNKEEDISTVLMFLRDVCIYRKQNIHFDKIVNQFRPAIEQSEIFQLMNQNLYSKNRKIRLDTVYAFGKMSFPKNTTHLKKAIGYYKEHFPNDLEGLEFEYNWLLTL